MKNAPPRDVGASVRARLLRLARERGEDFQLVLTRYANERLLFRLATSRHGERFVLKGAALFTLWTGKPHRATRDLDLLGFGDPGEGHVRQVFAEVLALAVAVRAFGEEPLAAAANGTPAPVSWRAGGAWG
jgi:predicted nucleotidyltransferase component of viral defense system